MRYRSQAQRDAQLNAMEAARGAAARRAEARRREAEAEAARQAEFDGHVHQWSSDTGYAYPADGHVYVVQVCRYPNCTQGSVRRVRF